jgi:hypothetical protein
MSSLTETLMTQAAGGGFALDRVVSEFSPAEIRQTIAELVARDQITLANAVSDAGISLHPQSEDILAISALLAEIQRDWPLAEQLLTQLIEIQGALATPHSWRHLIRVQRCHCEPGKALASARNATAHHPEDADLAQELADLQDLVGQTAVFDTPSRAQ